MHELGHSLTGILLKFKVNRIELYPYGGCSKLEYNINTTIIKEFLVLAMGPIMQIVFVYIIKLSTLSVPDYFYTYHYFILIFNLLPIFPLDGGRLLQLIFFLFFSYYYSYKYIIYFSYFLYLLLFLYFAFFSWNLLIFLILILLGFQIYIEIHKVDFYFDKFLIERYLYDYNFSKNKTIFDIKQMKRDYYHYFIDNGKYIDERQMLKKYFGLDYSIKEKYKKQDNY